MQYSLNSHAIGQVSVVNAVSSIGEQPKPFGKVFTPAPELRKVSQQRALLLKLFDKPARRQRFVSRNVHQDSTEILE